jgi:hypothetical protein
MAPGALPCLGRVPKQRLLSPEICRRRWRSCGTLSRKLPTPLGFSIPRLYIGEGASSGGDQGLLTPGGTARGWAAPPMCVGGLWPPFGSLSVLWKLSGKNKTSGTCFVQSREYFLCSFFETQKQQKTGNWHCGILSIG